MNLLRHYLVVLIVSALVFGGFSKQVVAKCFDQGQPSTLKAHGDKDYPLGKKSGSACAQCLCHQSLSNGLENAARLPVLAAPSETEYLSISQYPLDTDPAGIDHPPQLS